MLEADPPSSMGWKKDEKGAFQNPAARSRAKQVAEFTEAGFKFRADDSSWVGPDEMDKWAALLWKCGEDWVDLAKANEFHAKPEQAWLLSGDHFEVETTMDWEGGDLARWHTQKPWA